MKIAVIGAGAIGSLVAANLAKANSDVVLIGKKDQTKAINKQGLKIKKFDGEETIRLKAIDKIDQDYDLVIFATKTQDLEEAYQHNEKYLENCLVLTTQNGVQADNILSVHFEKDKMFSSIVMFGATYIKPGEITFNFQGDWIIGRPFSVVDEQTRLIAETLSKGFEAVISMNIVGMKWLKLFVNFNNCIPALIGKSMQETFADMDLCRLSILLLKEGVDIVQKSGIEMVSLPNFTVDRIIGLVKMPEDQSAGIINKTLTTLSKEPLYGSILQSIMRKRTSEIDFINGEVVHLAASKEMKALLNSKIVDMVHKVEKTGKFYQISQVKQEFNLV